MGILENWNKNKFSIYNSEEKTVLKLIEKLGQHTEEVIKHIDELENKNIITQNDLYHIYKLDKSGNFFGSWQGIDKPTESLEGINGTVEQNKNDVNNLLNNNCYVFKGEIPSIPNSHIEVYNMYDSLVSKYPHNVSASILGNNLVGNEIKAYTFTSPLVTNNVGERVDRGTIIITCCIHGDERSTATQLYLFLKEMLESKPPSILHQLKCKYRIKVIPVCNPYGYDNNSRFNSNGIDLARNFNANWIQNGKLGDYEYSGQSVASEKEVQLIQNYISSNIQSELLIDIHNTAQGDEEYKPELDWEFTWVNTPTNNSYRAKQLRQIYQTSIQELSELWSNRHSELEKGKVYGMYHHFNLANITEYGLKNNINSIQIETSWQVKKVDDERFGHNTVRIGTELIGNFLINTFKQLPLLNEDITYINAKTESQITINNGDVALIPLDIVEEKTPNVLLSYSGVVVPKGYDKVRINITSVYDKTLNGVFENRVYIAQNKDDKVGVNNSYHKDTRYITGANSIDRNITSTFVIDDIKSGNVIYLKTSQITGGNGNLLKARCLVTFEK